MDLLSNLIGSTEYWFNITYYLLFIIGIEYIFRIFNKKFDV